MWCWVQFSELPHALFNPEVQLPLTIGDSLNTICESFLNLVESLGCCTTPHLYSEALAVPSLAPPRRGTGHSC